MTANPSSVGQVTGPDQMRDQVARGLAAVADAIATMESDPGPAPTRDEQIAANLRAAGYPVVAGVERVEFALWDDGRLGIYDDDLHIEVPPEAVRRLALLLGVPGALPT